MSRSLFSASWHSVAELKPALIPQVQIERHIYRGKVWFVLQEQSGGRYHRLTPSAYSLVAAMNGSRTIQTIWEQANQSGSGDECTQNDLVDLLVNLHTANLLQAGVTPDSGALLSRYKKKRQASFKQYVLNPMSIKIPLVDPDKALEWASPLFSRLFSPAGFLIWFGVMVFALIQLAEHWAELTHDLNGRLLSSGNLLVMALVFPVVKLLHELGHGIATKVWGGKVHEMGLMFLVFAPVPYVDASASSSFPSKTQRAIVAASGMMVELFLAALALYVWLLVEPGVVRAVAYNVMIIAGVSTLIVNGNPLLRYDAYYILTDLIEMPNLATRGPKYLAYVWDRYVFGVQDRQQPNESADEKKWLIFYTPLAWGYRLFVTLSISLFIANQFFFFGVVMALWGVLTQLGLPLWKAWRHVTRGPQLHRQRPWAIKSSSVLLALVVMLLGVVPAPLRTVAEGVVWLPDNAMLRAGESGFFRQWLVKPGSVVTKGTPVFVLDNPELSAELSVAKAKVDEASARYQAEQFTDLTKAAVSRRVLQQEQTVLAKLEQKAALLIGYAESDGVLVAARPEDFPMSFMKKGELVGHILERKTLFTRVVISQDNIDLVRSRSKAAEIRFADSVSQRHVTDFLRRPAGGVNELPSAALSVNGGGVIPTLPDDPQNLKTLDRYFVVDLRIPANTPPAAFGERVYVRFDHGWEPLAWQWLRRLRQLFLSHFNV